LLKASKRMIVKHGLYEQVISETIKQQLDLASDKITKTQEIDPAEASKILSYYVSAIIEKELANIKDSGGDLQKQVDLVNQIISTVADLSKEPGVDQNLVHSPAEQLLAYFEKSNNILAVNEKSEIVRPETSISQSSLFTGAIHEPSMVAELKKEILSCDKIDMLVSFIRWSGLRLMINELQSFTQKGGQLRIITTSYMGATDIKAIDELNLLPNTQIKVSYDTKTTRLHAKAYVFYRNTGFTTAYVGSSNLSKAAISSGLEWNVKVTKKDLNETIQKIEATFESYWNSSDFETYSNDQRDRLESAIFAERNKSISNEQSYHFDIIPYPFQQEILDKLEAERKIKNHYKNLIVAATGTGKTVISAFDYLRYRKENPMKPNRLLFIAHREEILKQSLDCFRGILKDSNFGELFVGIHKPAQVDHLFMSIQTFNSQEFHNKTTPDFYDFIIVDEFHHAAAKSYQKLLEYYNPKILLGLTATPERMDGKNILEYFDNRIAADIRLPEAIERRLLCPFQYFGVTDTVDLTTLKWTRGGYEKSELSKIYSIQRGVAEKRAGMIIESIRKYVTDTAEVKGLGFCVSVDHAKFMAEFFTKYGISCMYLTSDSPDDERNAAKNRLTSGEIRWIFVVDLYNEGIDIPEINTVLFLRPTESLTVFLQQLGRGLRLSEGKECLTVLDFIGQANKKYNFEDKFAALLSNSTKSVQREIKDGFASVPKGCYIQLEKKAKEYILDNIRSSFGLSAGMVSRIKTFKEDSQLPLTLENFVDYYHLDVRSIYRLNNFSRFRVAAGIKDDFDEPLEEIMNKAFPRICAIDSRRWITFLLELFKNLDTKKMNDFTESEKRMLQMFQFTIWQKPFEDCGFESLLDGFHQIKECPVLHKEIIELLTFNFNRIDFIDEPVQVGFDCPLDIHCTYSRDQILVAMDYMKPGSFQEGVKYFEDWKLDLFLITLNKSDKNYSPTTMYKDYSINETLFHWQTQSKTAENSTIGQRYIHQRETNNKILLFVREFKIDLSGTSPYTFLGLADYVKHEGSQPINIIWELQKPIPAKYLKMTNKLVVG